MTTAEPIPAERLDPVPGTAVYTPRVLGIYDPLVLGFSNSVLWRCPTSRLLAWYDAHVSARHLDVGVGSGYFLDHCRFPSPSPSVALLDYSVEALRFTERRIARLRPVSYRASILEPVKLPTGPFESIGLNFVLHCLPGDMASKARVFRHLRPHLADGGVLFGSTILGDPSPRSALARAVMHAYNARGIFGNRSDTAGQLEAALRDHFDTVEVKVHGSVALFAAWS